MEVIELLGMTAVDIQSFARIEEGGEYHSMVDFHIGGKAESSSLPDILSESSEGRAGFGYQVFHFCLNVYLS